MNHRIIGFFAIPPSAPLWRLVRMACQPARLEAGEANQSALLAVDRYAYAQTHRHILYNVAELLPLPFYQYESISIARHSFCYDAVSFATHSIRQVF